MQRTNLKPDKAIAAIDIVGVDDGKWGAPAVFAITTGQVGK